MLNIIDYKANTIGDEVKRVVLPFGGFYESIYVSAVSSQLDDMVEDGVDKDVVQKLGDNIDWSAYYLKVANGYADYMNERFSEVFGREVEVAFTQVQVHPMTRQNTGDEISAAIDVKQLPTLATLQTFCSEADLGDFQQSLKDIAKSKFDVPGMYSTWDADISKLFSKSYDLWESVYIECLLCAMVQVVSFYDGHDSDQWSFNINSFENDNFLEDAYIKGIPFIDNLYADEHLSE